MADRQIKLFGTDSPAMQAKPAAQETHDHKMTETQSHEKISYDKIKTDSENISEKTDVQEQQKTQKKDRSLPNEKLSKGDFVEVEFTGKLKDEGIVFDTTSEQTAKDSGIHNKNASYGSLMICVGESNVLPALDKFLEGKETGKKYTVDIPAEYGFGKRSASNIQLVPTMKFIKERIQPMSGLQVNIDGNVGMVKSVSGGRTLVDFNHPLAGKNLVYEMKVFEKIKDARKKIGSILRMQLNLKEFFVEFKDGVATIGTPKKLSIPEQILKPFEEMIISLVPEVKRIEFVQDEKGKSK